MYCCNNSKPIRFLYRARYITLENHFIFYRYGVFFISLQNSRGASTMLPICQSCSWCLSSLDCVSCWHAQSPCTPVAGLKARLGNVTNLMKYWENLPFHLYFQHKKGFNCEDTLPNKRDSVEAWLPGLINILLLCSSIAT